MKLQFAHRRPPSDETLAQKKTVDVPCLIAQATTRSIQQQVALLQRKVRLFAFFASMLLVALLVPTSPVRQALGYGGGQL